MGGAANAWGAWEGAAARDASFVFCSRQELQHPGHRPPPTTTTTTNTNTNTTTSMHPTPRRY